MSDSCEVTLEIWFDGKDNRTLIKFTSEDAARFELEYAAWLKSGLPAGEFQYSAAGKTVCLRFDPIVVRKITPSKASGPQVSS